MEPETVRLMESAWWWDTAKLFHANDEGIIQNQVTPQGFLEFELERPGEMGPITKRTTLFRSNYLLKTVLELGLQEITELSVICVCN